MSRTDGNDTGEEKGDQPKGIWKVKGGKGFSACEGFTACEGERRRRFHSL